MNIDEMKPGRELDALVAEKVMGWRRVSEGEPYFWPTQKMIDRIKELHPDVLAVDYFPAPLFSADIAAAWQIVEKADWWQMESVETGEVWVILAINESYSYDATANAAPHAICLAALKAVNNGD